jgi:hypothetical protein
MNARRAGFLRMPEGRQIARISCHRYHRTVELDAWELRGLRGTVPRSGVQSVRCPCCKRLNSMAVPAALWRSCEVGHYSI